MIRPKSDTHHFLFEIEIGIGIEEDKRKKRFRFGLSRDEGMAVKPNTQYLIPIIQRKQQRHETL